MAIHSDWGDWLPRAVADADPDTVAIWYLGCNGFILKGAEGTTLFIDPYLGMGDPPRTIRMIPVPFDPADVAGADAVLATHEHTDHVHGPSQAPILERTGATFYGTAESVAVTEDEGWRAEYDIQAEQIETITVGDTLEIGEFTVHVEVAHDPDADGPVSFVIEHESGTFFHGGDTKPSDDFARVGQEYDIDVGVLAFGTVGNIPDKETREPKVTKWYNDENEAVEAASALQFDRFVPTHFDMWKGLTADPKGLHHHAASFAYPQRLDLVEIGDRIDL